MATGGYTTAPIHKNRTTTLGRIQNFLSDGGLFRDLNLPPKIYGQHIGFLNDGPNKMTHWELPGPSGSWKNYKPIDIIQNETFEPASSDPNDSWIQKQIGPTWHTHWFKIELQVPDEWKGKEVHLRWASDCEAAVYNTAGEMLQGLSPGFREEYILSRNWLGTEGPMTFYIECSVNGMFGAGSGDMIAATNNNMYVRIQKADIAPFDRMMYKIVTDMDMLKQIAEQLSNDHRGYQAMFTANEMVNLIKNDQNYEKASEIADAFFAQGGGEKNHTLVSMGHCHIDTAWLWDYDETRRKTARSWTAQMGLMREYPDYTFTCSSAQQYEWLKTDFPDVFTKVKQYVAQGKFVPVGGTWIEMDGNIPSGESFIRQFFYGQRLFQQEFGKLCKEFWLPDTFGYSAQIPQILKHVNINRFLTQKMSWNLVNKFPHHNFFWEGIDGSQVLTHFPPGDSYNMGGSVSELLYSVNNSQDKGRANTGIYLYGQGDGGGGATRQMIERQNRVKNCDGLPRIVYEGPDYFFKELEKESDKLCKWVGELYLELHNGTYTSQAAIKWYNRKGEFFLREIELLMAIAVTTGKVTAADYAADQERVDRAWKNVLLNQFHDVLPGSCVEIAAQTARTIYEETFQSLSDLRKAYNSRLLPAGSNTTAVFNPLPWDVRTVIFSKPDSGSLPGGAGTQQVDLKSTIGVDNALEGGFKVPGEFTAALVNLSANGYSTFTPIAPTNPVVFSQTSTVAQFSNGLVRVETQRTGLPYEEIYFTGKNGEHKVFNDRLNTGIRGGMFYIYDDVPLYWDAWDLMDYHLENRKVPDYAPAPVFERITTGESVVGVSRMRATFGNSSTIERYTVVRADSPLVEYYTIIDWKENRKILKAEFPVDILSREATYEIQYGHAKRPTHMNTSWDMAKFEVCGHKWIDISQADKGVAIITDSKYGWHVRDNIVKLSLLKAPKNPDANCDMGKHFIYYAVYPHEGTLQEAEVIQRAYELNVFGANNIPLLATSLAGADLPAHWVRTDNPAVIVEAFKVAHDDQRACLVRLYESHGGAANTTISLGFPVTKVMTSDGMENPQEAVPVNNNSFSTSFTPFQIRSFLVSF